MDDMDAQAAARMGDEIAHGFGLLAMVAGAVLGAIVGAMMIPAVVAATVATTVATIAIMTGAIAGGGLSLAAFVKGFTKHFHIPEPASGVLAYGSPDILFDYRPAMRVGDLAVACSGLPFNHFSLPGVPIAEGSATVFFNGKPAARVGSKMVCGAHISSGSPTVIIGGPSVRIDFVWDVEQWIDWSLSKLAIFAIGAGAVSAAIAGAAIAGIAGAIAGGGVYAGVVRCFQRGFIGLGKYGDDKLGPGGGDMLQGVAGLLMLGLGAKLAKGNNRSVPTEESSAPWYDIVLNKVKTGLPTRTAADVLPPPPRGINSLYDLNLLKGSGSDVGNMSKISGKSIEEIVMNIPKDASIRKLTPAEGGSQSGIEYKWIDENGMTNRFRMHDPDPSAGAGSNSAKGWTARWQVGKKYYDPIEGDFRHSNVHNSASPYYDPKAANNTHIPIQTPGNSLIDLLK